MTSAKYERFYALLEKQSKEVSEKTPPSEKSKVQQSTHEEDIRALDEISSDLTNQLEILENAVASHLDPTWLLSSPQTEPEDTTYYCMSPQFKQLLSQ